MATNTALLHSNTIIFLMFFDQKRQKLGIFTRANNLLLVTSLPKLIQIIFKHFINNLATHQNRFWVEFAPYLQF